MKAGTQCATDQTHDRAATTASQSMTDLGAPFDDTFATAVLADSQIGCTQRPCLQTVDVIARFAGSSHWPALHSSMAARPSYALQPRRCVTVPVTGRCRTLGLFDGRIGGQAVAATAIRAVDTTLASASSKGSIPRGSHAAGAHLDG